MANLQSLISNHKFWLAVVILLAAFLRLWQLGDMPPGFYHDEAYNGLDALSLVEGKTFPQFYEGWELYPQEAHGDHPPQPTRFPIFFEGNYGREPVHIYLMALSVWLLGATPLAVRLVPALAGVLAVWTTYLAAKALLEIGDWRLERPQSPISNLQSLTPVLAAFFVAVLFPAIHFSRFGLRAMLFVPVQTLTIYFFWRGINNVTRSPRHYVTLSFVLAGFLLGLGLYIYAAGRLFPLLFMLFVPIWFWRDRMALQQHWQDVAVMAGVSVITAVPLLRYFAQYPYYFTFRIAYVANKGKGAVEGQPLLTWFNNIGRVIRGLYWQGETHLRHNLPGRPFLDTVQAILFSLGLLRIANCELRKETRHSPLATRYSFLLLWLIVMLLPTIMSGDAPHFGRMSGAIPPLAILMAVGFAWLWARFTPLAPRLLLISLLALSAAITTYDYFGRYASHPQLTADFYRPDWELGQYAASYNADTAIYLTPTQEELATIYFALADPARLTNFNGGLGLIPAGQPGGDALYLVRPDDSASWHALTTFYDGYVADTGRPDFWALYVSDSAEQALKNVETAVSIPFADQISLQRWSATVNDDQLIVTLVWQATADMPLDYTAFVHLLDQTGDVIAQQDRPPAGYPTSDWEPGELVVDRFVVDLAGERPLPPYTLQTGFYDLATMTRLGDSAVLTDNFSP